MIIPVQQNDVFLNDVKSFNSSNGFKIWWLGQSGFLIKWQGKHLLFDPYLSDSLSVKYRHTDKPHVRMSEIVVGPEKLDFIDIVTSSHNHTDHLDADTLQPILYNSPGIRFIIPEANRDFVVDRLKCAKNFPIGLNDDTHDQHLGFNIAGIPAAHNEMERDENGRCRYMGYVARFGRYSVYHSGDTLWYEGLEKILQSFHLDVALLPINGNKPERRVAGNLDAEEAAHLGKLIHAKMVIPHHYHLFEFNTEDPENFAKACQKYGTNYRILRLGEAIEF